MRIPIPDAQELQGLMPDLISLDYVARGGFKAVFRATDRAGLQEAVKAIFIPAEADGYVREQIDQLVARAQREIDALALCTAPCIVKLGSRRPSLQPLGGHTYLIYSEEFVGGEALSTMIGRLPPPDHQTVHAVFSFLLDVIAEMIRIQHLHRDIKPANIMVTGQANRPYVILDMGIAYKMHGTQLTQGNGPPGTLRYMAPELFSPNYKDVMDFRCDLYSAGLTVYELAAGWNPFAPRPENDRVTQYRIMNERPPALETVRADLPPRLCRLVDRCIKKNPALRYSQIEQLCRELQESVS